MDKKLDISPLIKAYESYVDVIDYVDSLGDKENNDIFFSKEIIRPAIIQHFEYTYELARKMMKKYIEIVLEEEVDIFSWKDLFRLAGEKALITDFKKWAEFNKGRNKTSHVYDEEIAEDVYALAIEFKDYLEDFIIVLKDRI